MTGCTGKAKQNRREKAHALIEKPIAQRQGRRGRSIWQSRSQRAVIYLKLGLIFLSFSMEALEQKMVYLISPPRSLSVAFLRMMNQRGDFAIIHEPGIAAFNLIHNPVWANTIYRSDIAYTFSEVRNLIFQTAARTPVFIKEMGFAASEYLPHMLDLVSHPNAYFVFLVRHPHHALLSHYRKNPEVNDTLNKVLNYKELYLLYQEVKNKSAHIPLVLITEQLYAQPREIIQHFCHAIEIPFKEESLQWEDLGDSFSGLEEWNETKHSEITQYWHKEAIRSTGFGIPTTTYVVDQENQPTFEEIENLELRRVYQKMYNENLPYYKSFLEIFCSSFRK